VDTKSAIIALLLLGWSGAALGAELNVVASFPVLADMATAIGGSHVHVRSLVGSNGDPHAYEPSPRDAKTIAAADLILVNGLALEGWMDRLITTSGTKGVVVVASAGVASRHMQEDGKEITDPHAWNSAANGAIYARNITQALVAADPDDASVLAAGGARYEAELQALDAWAHQTVATIPLAKRVVITSHDAFGYLGNAYGIEFRAPIGFSTEAEAGAGDVAALINQMKREGIKAVFLENSNDPRMVQQIAAATGARIGGTLYAEALSSPDGPAGTYARMFRYNIETLVRGMRAN
jgi:zinc/manganese transport system substrate-binding protein